MSAAAIEIRSRATPLTAIMPIVRAIVRTCAFIFFSLIALAEVSVVSVFVSRTRKLRFRSRWLHRWCRFACLVLGIKKTVTSTVPSSGLIVCNHLSYLDIIVFSSTRPCVFVAKKDVAAWPLFGWLARGAGTVFADRNHKSACLEAVDSIRSAVNRGGLVILFAEGTSSDGRSVLPFKSALLEPALQTRCNVSAATIDYSLPHGGSVADEVCYWRDMTLVPHLLNLFSKREIDSTLVVVPAECSIYSRKELARDLRRQIIEMRS
jgi:1-acyl-sn-glycerol-3-phosphate acyltransferase